MGAAVEHFPDDAVDLVITADPDRTPLIVEEDENGQHWVGIAGPGGEMLPMATAGTRSHKAYRPLTMDDRFVCWHPTADYYEVVRLGAMTHDDLLCAVHNAEYRSSPSLLSQSLLWLWYRIGEDLHGNFNSGNTIETLNDEEGHSVLDHDWRTAL
jgi:hypothetical protein